jgi:hypothetical protein
MQKRTIIYNDFKKLCADELPFFKTDRKETYINTHKT